MNKKRILIVDDEPHVCRLLKIQLEREGYQVDSAFNGEQALEKLQQGQPDVLVTDIQMPRMDGQELCQRIHADMPNRRFPIFVLTSRTEVEHREWSRDLPRSTFLEKPVSVRRLIAELKAHFESVEGEAT